METQRAGKKKEKLPVTNSRSKREITGTTVGGRDGFIVFE